NVEESDGSHQRRLRRLWPSRTSRHLKPCRRRNVSSNHRSARTPGTPGRASSVRTKSEPRGSQRRLVDSRRKMLLLSESAVRGSWQRKSLTLRGTGTPSTPARRSPARSPKSRQRNGLWPHPEMAASKLYGEDQSV